MDALTCEAAYSRAKPLLIPDEMLPLISENLLIREEKQIRCVACPAQLQSVQTLLGHTKGKNHQQKLVEYKAHLQKIRPKNFLDSNIENITTNESKCLKLSVFQFGTNIPPNITALEDGNNRYDRYVEVDNMLTYSKNSRLLLTADKMLPLILENLLIREEKQIRCFVCPAQLQSAQAVLTHTRSKKHEKKLVEYKANLQKIKPKHSLDSSTENITANAKPEKSKRLKSNVSQFGTNVPQNITTLEENERYRYDRYVEVDNMQTRSSKSNLLLTPGKMLSLILENLLIREEKQIRCFVCPAQLHGAQTLLDHTKSKNHKKKLVEYKANLQKIRPKNSLDSNTENITANAKPEESKCLKSSVFQSGRNIPPNITALEEDGNSRYDRYMEVDNMQTCSSESNLLLIPDEMLPLISENLLIREEKQIRCVACTVQLLSAQSLLDHTNSKNHEKKLMEYKTQLQKIEPNNSLRSSIKNITAETQPKISTCSKSILSQSGTDILQETTAQTENGSNRQKQYTNTDMGNIYKVNLEKLRTIKLSCQLCFPKSMSYLYCLICERSITNQLQSFHEHICSPPHTLYLAELEANDLPFVNYPDQFSDLALLKEFIQEVTDDIIQCFACDKQMQNIDSIIAEHVLDGFHKERKRQWNKMSENKILKNIIAQTQSSQDNIKVYWCQLCDFKSHSGTAFVKHLNEEIPNSCFEKMRSNPSSIIYDSCIPCATLWLGSVGVYGYHCKEKDHKYQVKDYQKVTKITLPQAAANFLNDPVQEVKDLIKLSDQVSTTDHCRVDTLINHLEQTVNSAYPKAKAYPFGSRVSGLGFPDSDIDVFLDCGTYRRMNVSEKKELRIMDTVVTCLIHDRKSWEIEEVLRGSRIPIIKLYHRSTELRCDVSFKNGLSVENTKLLKCFIDNYPMARRLILFLKKWLAICKLSGSQYITNYAMCWYIIFYLQTLSILPSVADLIRQANKSRMIAGWETGICDKFVAETHESSFLQLLQGFFKFYANFDYRHSVACPLVGYTIFKQDFEDLSYLPEEMETYIDKIETSAKRDLLFRIDSPMCIQDPYDLSHNLTTAVKKCDLDTFKQYCEASAEVLNNLNNHFVVP